MILNGMRAEGVLTRRFCRLESDPRLEPCPGNGDLVCAGLGTNSHTASS
jgi:hypothetical protein